MIAAACLLLTTMFAPTTSANERVKLPSAWETGQDWRLELVKGREDEVKKTRSSTPLQLSVEAKSESGYIFRWVYGKTAITAGLPEEARARFFAERMSSISEGLVLDVLCSPSGNVQGLAQLDKVLTHYEQMMVKMHGLFMEAKVPQATIDNLLKQTFDAVTGPNMQELTLKEARLFLRFAGMELELNKRIEYETELPNPLGGDPYPALGWFEARAIPDQPGELQVESGTKIDAEKALALMLQSVSELAKQAGKPAPKPEQLPKIEVEEHSMHIIERANGLPRFVEHTRTTLVGSKRRIDLTELRRLPPLAPPATDKR
jgi:hypothetical protein